MRSTSEPLDDDRRHAVRQLRQPERLVVDLGGRGRRRPQHPDQLGAHLLDREPTAQQRRGRQVETEALHLQPDALAVGKRQPGEPHVERHATLEPGHLDRACGTGQRALELGADEALAAGRLRDAIGRDERKKDQAQRDT